MTEAQHGDRIVDVVIAAWNCSGTIERAIRSALAEPEVRNVLVVDDASSDATLARAEDVAREDGRVTVCALPSNRGPSAARNAALALSSAPWVTVLDGDDFFLPGRIGKLLAAGAAFDFVADDLLEVDEAQVGRAQPRPALMRRSPSGPLDFKAFVAGNASRRGSPRRELGFLKPLMRRDFLARHGLRYEEALRLGEDYALYAHALALGARFLVLPACGYVAVVRANSLSGAHTKQDLESLRDFDRKLEAISGLSPAERRAVGAHTRSVDARVRWLAVIEGFRARSLARFLSPFACSPRVSGFLVRQLVAEGVRRLSVGLSQ